MKYRRLFIFALVIIIVSVSLTGCKKQLTTAEEEPEAVELDNLPSDEFIISEEETPFTMATEDGKTVYLDENSPNLVALQKVIAKFLEANTSVDWRTITGEETKKYMSDEFQQKHDFEADITYITEHEIISELSGINYLGVHFEGNTAIAHIENDHSYQNGKDIPREINQLYCAEEKIKLSFNDGTWLISDDELLEVYHYEEEGK